MFKKMLDHKNGILVMMLSLVFTASFAQKNSEMALVKGGEYIPLYGSDSTLVEVDEFYMDKFPVTNAQYLEFLKNHPEWVRSAIKPLFADDRYLATWESDLSFGKDNLPDAPVTNVSWFAAKKYCECQGKRLPKMDEWEFVAMADETTIDARIKQDFNQRILSWYETANTYAKPVGSTFRNYWGVYDMHGLVWEWTMDFNSVLLSPASRGNGGGDSNLFCGSSAIGATDLMDYAAFMRYAFRRSIKARYDIKNLGFRCAKSINDKNL
ncbi:hypothetical protein C7S20_04840 [Christiangramia fulva]|uniref:Sulfatase-modifying factor enzyme-like domain-containing protein n=1 Tax=Christiangramia fulva TaxID=2126553 RepID=A0A2R3Z300_9FLAO|nr:formylglycine-generating enzyme family protein [Christiangramia fulva]AVR44641.1 hypothetical protein C7S20_04840 [Christiangramia fulva]